MVRVESVWFSSLNFRKGERMSENVVILDGVPVSIEDLRMEMAETLFIPNKCLPPALHGNREHRWIEGEKHYGRSGASLLRQIRKAEQIDELEKHRREKESRIQEYARQVEQSGTFNYREFVLDAPKLNARPGDLF